MSDAGFIGATPPDQNMLIVGPRGSGKSVFAAHQLMATPHAIALDTKGDFGFADPAPRYHLAARTIEQLVRHLQFIEAQERDSHFWGAPVTFTLPPNVKEARTMCDEAARIAMRRGATRLYYDELVQAINCSNYENEAPHFQAVIQQGRSRNVSATMSTQRPKRIPLICGSEAEARVTFFLRHPADQKAVEDLFGVRIPWHMLAREKHSYVQVSDDTTNSQEAIELHRLILPSHPAQRSA